MTKYIVTAFVGNGKIDLAAPGRNPQRAVHNAQRDSVGRRASAFIVYERKTKNVVFATTVR